MHFKYNVWYFLSFEYVASKYHAFEASFAWNESLWILKITTILHPNEGEFHRNENETPNSAIIYEMISKSDFFLILHFTTCVIMWVCKSQFSLMFIVHVRNQKWFHTKECSYIWKTRFILHFSWSFHVYLFILLWSLNSYFGTSLPLINECTKPKKERKIKTAKR